MPPQRKGASSPSASAAASATPPLLRLWGSPAAPLPRRALPASAAGGSMWVERAAES